MTTALAHPVVARVAFDSLTAARAFDALLAHTRALNPEMCNDRICVSAVAADGSSTVAYVYTSHRLVDAARARVRRECDAVARAVNDARAVQSIAEIAMLDDEQNDAHISRWMQTTLRVSGLISLLVSWQDAGKLFAHVR
jgi:hypothetical protein